MRRFVSRLLAPTTTARRPASARRTSLQVEALEKREVMSVTSVTLNAGTLRVMCDAADDNVEIRQFDLTRALPMSAAAAPAAPAGVAQLARPVVTTGLRLFLSNITVKDLTRPTNNTWTFNAADVQRIEAHTGAGNDRFVSNTNVPTTVWTGDGSDYVVAGDAADLVYLGAGNDTVYANGKNEVVQCGSGNDLVSGGSGINTFYGGAGSDSFFGGSGTNILFGGTSPAGSLLYGGSGTNTIYSSSRNDVVDGGKGHTSAYVLAGTWVVRNCQSVTITVPTDQPQTDGWSCGPNSGSRLLRAYGIDASYADVRSRTSENSLISRYHLGTLPDTLRDVLKHWKSDISLKTESNLQFVLDLLGSGRPVIALVGVAKKSLSIGGSYGVLHYVLLNGFDLASQTIQYVDTNGVQKSWSFSDFDYHWKWFDYFSGILGKSAEGGLYALGLRKRTILY
jgi:hypothetical protein